MTTEQLTVKANRLYADNATSREFARTFTMKELVQLWYYACVYTYDSRGHLTEPEAFDDEVYNALNMLGYWKFVETNGQEGK